MTEKYYEFAIDYFQDEDGVFIAVVPALPGCTASGVTIAEAFEAVKSAIESCVEAREKLDLPIAMNSYAGKNFYRLSLPVAA